MKGKLVKREDKWIVEYEEHGVKSEMPLYPSELKTKGLWKLKNKEVKFEIEKLYTGFRTIGDPEDRNYVELYQNYAKIIK